MLSCRQVAEDENKDEEVQGGCCLAADRVLRMKTRIKRCRKVGAELRMKNGMESWRAGNW